MRALLAIPLLALFAAPAMAQDAPGDQVKLVTVFGDDECLPSNNEEIVICQRLEEGERFRIPTALRESDSPQNEAWNNRVLAYEMVGRSGIMSCSPSGAGGVLGCTQKLIDTAYREKGESPDIRFSELVAAERARRLETIDADAAETQARVEQLEKAYMDRLAKEDAAADAALPPLPEPKPQ
jgi:hypothetical protein